MSDFTYDIDDLGTTTATGRRNAVRFLVGDTDSTDVQAKDEEIAFALSQCSDNIHHAAAYVCRTIAAQYSRRVDTDLDGALSASYSDLHAHYIALADTLEAEAKKQSGLGVKAGGISEAAITVVRQDTDRVTPAFRRDRFRNPPNYDGSADYE
jgi:hypothetical protein